MTHNKQPNDFFVFFKWHCRQQRVGHFRCHVKIEQFVVPCRRFKSTDTTVTFQMFLLRGRSGVVLTKTAVKIPLSEYDHSLSSMRCWILVRLHWLDNFHSWLSIQEHNPPKDRQFILISVPVYLYLSIISMRNVFLESPCSSVQINTTNTKLLYFFKHKLHLFTQTTSFFKFLLR